MSIRIVLISLFLFTFQKVIAQEKFNYGEVDKKSYLLFQEKKWQELIRFSNQARKQGIDFFYLQVRTGLAYYNRANYGKAADYLLRAYSNDQSFDWLQEYLYYSLVYSGRYMEALKYASKFPDKMKMNINFREKGVVRLGYEGGYGFNPELEHLKTRSFADEANLGTDYGESIFLKDYIFHSIDLSHKLAPDVILNHNFTYIGVNRLAQVDWSEQTSSPVRINQFQYFLNPVWVIGEKLTISPSINIIVGSGDVFAGSLSSDSAKVFSLSKFNYQDAIFSTAIWSNYGSFSPGAEINIGKLNDSHITQMSSWLTFYPFSNTRLFITPRVYFKSGGDGKGIKWNAFGITGGAGIGKLYFTGQYLTGDMENFIESVGYVIYNFPGRSEQKILGSIHIPVSKKCQFVFRYINQNINEKYQVYTNGYFTRSMEYSYLKHTLTTGISWNF